MKFRVKELGFLGTKGGHMFTAWSPPLPPSPPTISHRDVSAVIIAKIRMRPTMNNTIWCNAIVQASLLISQRLFLSAIIKIMFLYIIGVMKHKSKRSLVAKDCFDILILFLTIVAIKFNANQCIQWISIWCFVWIKLCDAKFQSIHETRNVACAFKNMFLWIKFSLYKNSKINCYMYIQISFITHNLYYI